MSRMFGRYLFGYLFFNFWSYGQIFSNNVGPMVLYLIGHPDLDPLLKRWSHLMLFNQNQGRQERIQNIVTLLDQYEKRGVYKICSPNGAPQFLTRWPEVRILTKTKPELRHIRLILWSYDWKKMEFYLRRSQQVGAVFFGCFGKFS